MVAMDRDRLDAFASAVRDAKGLPEELQGDLISLLRQMPVAGEPE